MIQHARLAAQGSERHPASEQPMAGFRPRGPPEHLDSSGQRGQMRDMSALGRQVAAHAARSPSPGRGNEGEDFEVSCRPDMLLRLVASNCHQESAGVRPLRIRTDLAYYLVHVEECPFPAHQPMLKGSCCTICSHDASVTGSMVKQ